MDDENVMDIVTTIDRDNTFIRSTPIKGEKVFNNRTCGGFSLALPLGVRPMGMKESVFADDIPREIDIDFIDENTTTGRKEGVEPVFEDIFADTSWDIL